MSKTMHHSFVYRGLRIEVSLRVEHGVCSWTAKSHDAASRWTGRRAVSMGEGLRLACLQARSEIDRRDRPPAPGSP